MSDLPSCQWAVSAGVYKGRRTALCGPVHSHLLSSCVLWGPSKGLSVYSKPVTSTPSSSLDWAACRRATSLQYVQLKSVQKLQEYVMTLLKIIYKFQKIQNWTHFSSDHHKMTKQTSQVWLMDRSCIRKWEQESRVQGQPGVPGELRTAWAIRDLFASKKQVMMDG